MALNSFYNNDFMFTRIYWLHTNANGGKLGIMARPRSDDWLEQEINHFKKQGIGVIVSLLEATEIQELGLQKQSALCAGQEIMFLQFLLQTDPYLLPLRVPGNWFPFYQNN